MCVHVHSCEYMSVSLHMCTYIHVFQCVQMCSYMPFFVYMYMSLGMKLVTFSKSHCGTQP
jgi:predicted nucleotide-binding protein (sugar kinase/HSP70/actin superfamily)